MEQRRDILKEKFDEIMCLYRDNKAVEAIDQVQVLLTMASEQADHYYYATGCNFLGVLQMALGNVASGVDYYFEAMIYAEKHNVEDALSAIYNNIASRYLDSGSYRMALTFLSKSEKKIPALMESEHISTEIRVQRRTIIAVNTALCYTNMKKYDQSEIYLAQVEKYLTEGYTQGIGFACAFLHCQNQYYLGNVDYVRENLDNLIDGIEQLVSMYSYEQNITEMFKFLIEIGETDKLKWLLGVVEKFTQNRQETQYKLLALKLRAEYEKNFGSQADYQACCAELVEVYAQKDEEILQEREQYMNLRMEMKRVQEERNHTQKQLSDMIQTVVNQEYEYIAYIDMKHTFFSVQPSNKMREEIALSDYTQYEALLTNFILKDADADEQSVLNGQLQLDFVWEQLETADEYSLIVKQTNEEGTHTYKKLLFSYIDRNEQILLLAQMDVTKLLHEEREQKKQLTAALAEAESANAATSAFLSTMSHEIRTPLNAVIGYITMAQNNMADETKLNSYHAKAQIAAKHLLSIINDVLDLSAIASGHFKVEYAAFDLKQIIGDINTMFMQQAISKGIYFEIDMKHLDYEFLIGDIMRVKQILLNLLSNAMKFTPEKGHITLTVEQYMAENDTRRWMRFDVADSGIGMTESFMQKIFTPFEQQDASISRKYGGTGLGLSISRQLAELMGGVISVQSQEHVGTTFTVCLPFEVNAAKENDEGTYLDLSGVRTLLVEPELVSARAASARGSESGAANNSEAYIQAMLKRLHLKSSRVMSGSKALRQLAIRKGGKYAYSLCIIDDLISDMPLEDLVTAIKQDYGDAVSIMVLTSCGVTDAVEKAKAAGTDIIIEKPLFQSVLFDFLVDHYGSLAIKSEKQASSAAVDFNGMQVLLAEDNEMNMEIAEEMLTRVNLNVTKAYNGRQACDKFLKAPSGTYQVILMDIQMPEMDGYEATKAIRQSGHPDAASIPIIALTANAFAEDVHHALEAGMNGHVAKPIDVEKLFEVIGKLV